MSNPIKNSLDQLESVFTIADQVLSDWKGNGNLQFPILMGMLAVKLNWDEKQVRENDPIVRYYVRNHSDWYVTRGAHGGIMRTTEKQKKEAEKTAKSTAKEQMKAAIEAKVAQAATANTDATDQPSVNNNAAEEIK